MEPTTRERLVAAAFELFESQGYDATTIDQIAAGAGVGRTTFFRNFAGKEDVLFPHHDDVLREVDARLATATPTSRSAALREAARIVLDHYLAEGDTARRRYRLTSTVPAVREREMAAVQRYQRVFSRHAAGWFSDEPDGALRAELIATAVITAHNYVLRDWLRKEAAASDLVEEFGTAMDLALESLSSRQRGRTTVVVARDGDVEGILRDVRSALTSDRP